MLRQPVVAAVRRCAFRTFVTDPFPATAQPDVLDRVLGGGSAEDDAKFPNPPQAPAGSVPSQSSPAGPLSKHALPSSKATTRLYHLHVHSSSNNTIVTFTNALHNTIAWTSGGRCGFKKVNRSSYEAAHQCAVQIFPKIRQEKEQSNEPMELRIIFKGFGQGREAMYRAFQTNEGESIRDTITHLIDRTPIKIGGTKAKKMRRL